MKCRICDRDSSSRAYCILHAKAYQNLTEKFEIWRKALDLSWKEYLSEIIKNPFTGIKAREVAEALLIEKQ